MRAFEQHDRTSVLRAPNGALELEWPNIKEIEAGLSADGETIWVHKYAAYVYQKDGLAYLAENKNRKIVLCVRDPQKSLVSWMLMHRGIAEKGHLPNHFAFKNRDFYLNCSVDEYFERFAKARLNYPEYFRNLASVFGLNRIAIVSQEKMSQGVDVVARRLVEFSQTGSMNTSELEADGSAHRARADRSEMEISDRVKEKLAGWRAELRNYANRPDVAAII